MCVEEEEQPKNDNIDSKDDSSDNKISDLDDSSNFNCVYVLISVIINLSLIIIAIIEYIINKYCTIFKYLVDILILLVFIFVIIYFFNKKGNFLKGIIYYPFISLFWGVADLLSIFISDNMWTVTHTLKVIKISLIIFSLFINVIFIKFCKE